MNNFIINIMNKYGYFGIIFLIAVENIFPPIPSEVILTLGGFMTSQIGVNMTLFGVIVASTVGSIIGAIILYYIGYILNIDRMIKLCDSKLGRVLCLKKEDIKKSYDNFNEKGNLSVLYSRFVPILRSLISIPAGMNKMKFSLFMIYTLIGSLIWNTVLCSLGKLVGSNYMIVANVFSKYSKIILFILIGWIVYKVIKLIIKKRKKVC